jgi:metacaspase-1
MLTANRFMNVPTKDCRDRLEAALANTKPIARGETHRGAVSAIQAALADLNRGYLFAAEIDGYFGSRTYNAVEAFQRDYGLAADGMVGKQTMAQLDSLYSGDTVRKPCGLSVHIGVDRLDPEHYGAEHALASCVNDARAMRDIAERLGYDAITYENEDATVSNFTGFMRSAIDNLYDGDSLLVTFSGHGSQLPNNSADVEADNADETLCFYDRMLIDDEFYALLGQFREGVRVHAVFDSCHSATVAKVIKAIEEERDAYHIKTLGLLKGEITAPVGVTAVLIDDTANEEPDDPEPKDLPISAKSLTKALDGDKPEFVEPKATKDTDDEIAALFTDLFHSTNSGKSKSIRIMSSVYDRNKALYDAVKNVVGPAENQELTCSVITLSACQDAQTTPAGEVYSLFTSNIIDSWCAGSFSGSYRQFHRSLMNISDPTATPAINTYGTNRANARLYDRPFVF